jgi:hypothetical protein
MWVSSCWCAFLELRSDGCLVFLRLSVELNLARVLVGGLAEFFILLMPDLTLYVSLVGMFWIGFFAGCTFSLLALLGKV